MTDFNRREWLAGSAALAGFAAMPSLARAQAVSELPEAMIHPELRAIARQFSGMMKNMPAWTHANLPLLRKPFPFGDMTPLPSVPFERKVIPVGKPHPDVAIYVINAKAGFSRPAILHTHGGGYIIGSAETSVRQMQELAVKLDCVIVTVEYRLAPETTYAGSIEDNYAGLKWLHANAASVGADPARIPVMGESAGGGHAAILALVARDRGEVPVCFQCLIYPMLDDRTGTTRKVQPWVGKMVWTPERNRFGWEAFLGARPGGAKAPKYAVPARMADLKGLPPAFIGVGTLDLFCDEDIDYAQRLNNAGVPAELIVVPGAFHGFDGIALMAKVPLGTWFENVKLNALRRGFGIPAA